MSLALPKIFILMIALTTAIAHGEEPLCTLSPKELTLLPAGPPSEGVITRESYEKLPDAKARHQFCLTRRLLARVKLEREAKKTDKEISRLIPTDQIPSIVSNALTSDEYDDIGGVMIRLAVRGHEDKFKPRSPTADTAKPAYAKAADCALSAQQKAGIPKKLNGKSESQLCLARNLLDRIRAARKAGRSDREIAQSIHPMDVPSNTSDYLSAQEYEEVGTMLVRIANRR